MTLWNFKGEEGNRDFASHTIQGRFKKFGPKLNDFIGKHEIIKVIIISGSWKPCTKHYIKYLT